MSASIEEGKRRAAEDAALLVEAGMAVGLGTGTTVSYLLPALARRGVQARYVATSVATEKEGLKLGLPVEAFSSLDRLDIAIDGADQISPDRWLVKGGGGAHVREKIVAAAAERFVVIASSDKEVPTIRAPIPLELAAFGLASTLRRLGSARIRDGWPTSPDGGVIADWQGDVDDPEALASYLDGQPGVVDHGLFPPALVTDVIVR